MSGPRAVLTAAFAVLAILLPGRAVAQAVGDPATQFLDATGAIPVAQDEGDEAAYRVGAVRIAPRVRDGLLVGLELRTRLDEEGVRHAADVLAIASGYGEGIREPLVAFLSERAPELAGEGPVGVRLEAYELGVEVHPGDPPEATLSLSLPRVADDRFGPPAASLGPDDAPVTIRVFSDFQCPYCRRYAQELMPRLEASVLASDDTRFEFHHFPLDGIHANASPAAEAAQCIADRYGDDAFWDYHDLLFERQAAWQGLGDVEPYLARLAGELDEDVLQQSADDGESPRAFVAACLDEGRTADTVAAARDRALSLGLSGTPTVFVGGFRLQDFGDPLGYARLGRLERSVTSGAGTDGSE